MTDTLELVTTNGMCIGCGGCAYAAGGQMELNRFGLFSPRFATEADSDAKTLACPFLRPEWNEDALADHFLPVTTHRSHQLGKFNQVLAAHVVESDYRRAGSSGGLGSWLGFEMLRLGMIDGVIHARPVPREDAEAPFFRYGISRTTKELREASHSHYHVVEIASVLAEVKSSPGRYLFIGIPCMVKALRRAQLADADIAERVTHTVALVCGHLKSVHWALSLGWGAGVPPQDTSAIRFRVKSENVPAKSYYFAVTDRKSGQETTHDSAAIPGGKFNLGAMMPEACNYCDDVVGETADITIGDAWLPRFAFDWRGKNMVVTRHPDFDTLISQAAAEGRILVDPMTPTEAVSAQAGGFRQRREGLRHRLDRAQREGRWTPKKRSLPDMLAPGPIRARIYDLRVELAQVSRDAFRIALDTGDFNQYSARIKRPFRRLRQLEILVSITRILSVRLQAAFSRKRS